jgi:hypothetical protein
MFTIQTLAPIILHPRPLQTTIRQSKLWTTNQLQQGESSESGTQDTASGWPGARSRGLGARGRYGRRSSRRCRCAGRVGPAGTGESRRDGHTGDRGAADDLAGDGDAVGGADLLGKGYGLGLVVGRAGAGQTAGDGGEEILVGTDAGGGELVAAGDGITSCVLRNASGLENRTTC